MKAIFAFFCFRFRRQDLFCPRLSNFVGIRRNFLRCISIICIVFISILCYYYLTDSVYAMASPLFFTCKSTLSCGRNSWKVRKDYVRKQ